MRVEVVLHPSRLASSLASSALAGATGTALLVCAVTQLGMLPFQTAPAWSDALRLAVLGGCVGAAHGLQKHRWLLERLSPTQRRRIELATCALGVGSAWLAMFAAATWGRFTWDAPALIASAAESLGAVVVTAALASLQPAPGVVVALAFLLWVVPSCLGLGVPSGSAPAWLLNLSQRISDNSAVRWMDLSPLLAVCIALLLSRRRSAS